MMPPFWQPVAVWLRPWGQLAKVPLCLPVAGSAGFGYILHTSTLAPSLAAVLCGVFLLACGAAAGNSLQETATDRLFLRTRHRPLVTGRLTVFTATWFSAALVTLGLTVLWLGTESRMPTLLGLTALVLYNGVYTPLKKTSVFAVFPGGLAGALPPIIGWTAAGGMLSDPRAWLLYSLFFLWQIPHFCLILLSHREDYCAVAQPALIRLLPEQSLQRLAFVWILAFGVVALALAVDRDLLQPGARLILAVMVGILTTFSIPLLLGRRRTPNYRRLFLGLNATFFSALLLVAVLQLLAAR